MARTLYLDCSSGISGDMLIAALLALAGDEGEQRLLQSLPAVGIDPSLVHSRPARRGGFEAREFVVAPEPGFATFDGLREAVLESALPDDVRADVVALAERMEAAEREVHGSDGGATVRPLRAEPANGEAPRRRASPRRRGSTCTSWPGSTRPSTWWSPRRSCACWRRRGSWRRRPCSAAARSPPPTAS